VRGPDRFAIKPGGAILSAARIADELPLCLSFVLVLRHCEFDPGVRAL
jgi:hypothetical protein